MDLFTTCGNHHPSFRNDRYFTLIELLIVIAIIAILAGMLLPALNNARESGKDISCRNNLKNYHLLMTNYADDFQSYYPQWQGGTYCWTRQLGELYLGHKYSSENYPILAGVNNDFHCPAGVIKREYEKKPRGYAMNAYAAGSDHCYSGGTPAGDISVNRRDISSKGSGMMLVADFGSGGNETFFGGNTGNVEYLYRYNGQYAMGRHKRKVNYVVKNGAVMQSAKRNDGSTNDIGMDIILFIVDQSHYVKNNKTHSF